MPSADFMPIHFLSKMQQYARTLRMFSLISWLSGCVWHGVAAPIPLYILGLYPMSGNWPGGQGQLPATRMGFQHINANQNILPNYELTLIQRDTEVRLTLDMSEEMSPVDFNPAFCNLFSLTEVM